MATRSGRSFTLQTCSVNERRTRTRYSQPPPPPPPPLLHPFYCRHMASNPSSEKLWVNRGLCLNMTKPYGDNDQVVPSIYHYCYYTTLLGQLRREYQLFRDYEPSPCSCVFGLYWILGSIKILLMKKIVINHDVEYLDYQSETIPSIIIYKR